MQNPFESALEALSRRSCAFACAATLAAFFQPSAAQAQTAAPTAPAKENEVFVLPQFVVATDKDRGYMSTNASSGTKLNQSLQEIPSTLSIVNQELIRDIGANSVQELLRYAPGVMVSANKSEDVQVRGFNLAVPLLDGFREPQGVPSEQVHVERVEILKGPAGILYGNTFGIGGIINRISKKPNFQKPVRELFVQVRDNNYYQASLDLGDPLGKHLAYRLITDNITSDDFQDFVSLKRTYLRPTLEWRPSNDTIVRLTLEYGDQKAHPEYNADAWDDSTNSLIKLPQQFNPGEDLFLEKTRRRAANLEVVHNIGSRWLLRNALQLTRQREDKGGLGFGVVHNGSATGLSLISSVFGAIATPDGSLTGLGGISPSAYWLLRNPTYTDRLVGNYFDQIDLAGNFETGSMKHTLTIGVEGTQDVDDDVYTFGFLSSIDLANRSYGALAGQYGDKVTSATRFGRIRTETLYWGGYVSDSMKLADDKIGINVALRYDDYQQQVETTYDPAIGGAHFITKFNARPHYMPRGGVVYNVTPNVAAYAGYSEAYVIVTNVDPNGERAKPEVGKEAELGLKAVLAGGRLSFNASIFQLDRDNIIEADPARPGFHRQVGSQRSKGLELSGIAVISKEFQMLASYAYTTGETSKSLDPTRVGLPLQAVPKHQAKAFGKYVFSSGALKNFGLGAGFNLATDREVWTAASIATRKFVKLPDAVVWDAALFYEASKSLSVSLNVRNVFDKFYYANGNEAAWQRGTPRGVVLSAHYKF